MGELIQIGEHKKEKQRNSSVITLLRDANYLMTKRDQQRVEDIEFYESDELWHNRNPIDPLRFSRGPYGE